MFIVIAKTQGTSYPYLLSSEQGSGKPNINEFDTVEAAKAACARQYRSLCANSGKPTLEATYTILDASKPAAVSTVVPPPN